MVFLTKDKKKQFYREMLRIRIIEEELSRYYGEQEMRCPMHFCIGQEAVAVGICLSLNDSDTVMSNHRSHGHYLAKGGDLRQMVAELYGKATGCALGKGGSMHLIDNSANFLAATSIVAGTIPVAVGVAFSNKLQGKKSVSTVFFGDAATEEGLFYESLNFAALHKLPVLFICENNLYSVYSPLHVRQPDTRRIYKIAKAMGVNAERICGNNVEAVYHSSQKALKYIYSGAGPYLIEAMTYRYLEHCGPNCDIELGYRTKEELLKWKKNDPLLKYEKRLLKESILSREIIAEMRREFLEEIKNAVMSAKSSPFPKVEMLLKDVYAE